MDELPVQIDSSVHTERDKHKQINRTKGKLYKWTNDSESNTKTALNNSLLVNKQMKRQWMPASGNKWLYQTTCRFECSQWTFWANSIRAIAHKHMQWHTWRERERERESRIENTSEWIAKHCNWDACICLKSIIYFLFIREEPKVLSLSPLTREKFIVKVRQLETGASGTEYLFIHQAHACVSLRQRTPRNRRHTRSLQVLLGLFQHFLFSVLQIAVHFESWWPLEQQQKVTQSTLTRFHGWTKVTWHVFMYGQKQMHFHCPYIEYWSGPGTFLYTRAAKKNRKCQLSHPSDGPFVHFLTQRGAFDSQCTCHFTVGRATSFDHLQVEKSKTKLRHRHKMTHIASYPPNSIEFICSPLGDFIWRRKARHVL